MIRRAPLPSQRPGRRRALLSAILGAGVLLGVAVGAPRPAAAEPILAMDERLGGVRGWDIGINVNSVGCLAKAKDEDQTTVWFGFADGSKAFFGLSNPRWSSIDEGATYKLELIARGAGNWRGDFTGTESGRDMGFIATGLKDKFMVDLARAGGIEVKLKNKTLARLSLAGSMAALDAVIDCQKVLLERLKQEQKERAQAQARAPAKPDDADRKGGADKDKGEGKGEGGESSGTGFFVSDAGHVLTNFHVIDKCKAVDITRQGSVPEPVQVLARDATNDLALLKAATPPAVVPSLAPRARIGEPIYVYGFPLAGLLATSGNFTVGNVTATSGLGDDSRMLQISAPVQPGNSGGPLLDQYGNVAGVVVSKLNALQLAAVTQDLAQNVNFAIKSSVAQTFLDGNSVMPPIGTTTGPALDGATIAEQAKRFTVFVRCKS